MAVVDTHDRGSAPGNGKAEARAGKVKQGVPGGSMMALDLGLPTDSGQRVTVTKSLTCTAVYRAVSILATTIATLPIHVRRRTMTAGQPSREILFEGPHVDWLKRPNPEQTHVMFFEHLVASVALRGNFYAEIVRGPMGIEVWPLPPNRVELGRNTRTNELGYVVNGDNGKIILLPKDVLHVAIMGDGLVGMSPIALARESIGLAIAAEKSGSSLFGSGFMPSGVLKHPMKLSPEAFDNLRKQKMDRGDGKRRVLILEEGMDWASTTIDPKDGQFLETRTFQVQEIARLFGVPPHMLADNTQAHFNNAAHQRDDFVQFTLGHWLKRIEEECDRKLLTKPDEFFRFDVTGLLRGDFDTQTTFLRKLVDMGAVSPNEIRAWYDLAPLPEGGDKYLLAHNLQSFELAMDPPEPEPEPAMQPDQPDAVSDPPMDDDPDDAVRMADAFGLMFRDAVGRVVNREVTALRRIAKGGEPEKKLKEFIKRHEEYVVGAFGPVWTARGMAAGRLADVRVERGASQYINDVRAKMTKAFAESGVDGLLKLALLWSEYRSANVESDWLERGYE